MQWPSAWLCFMVAVYGVLGCFSEHLYFLLYVVPVPLGAFFNASTVRAGDAPLSDVGVQTLVSRMSNWSTLGEITSTLFLLPLMNSFGRKKTLIVVRTLTTVTAGTAILAAHALLYLPLFAVGQFVVGLGVPVRLSLTVLYLTECAPDGMRAFVTECVAALNAVMIVLINVLALPALLGNPERWHWFVFLAFALLVLFLPMALIVPESPKFLAFNGAPKSAVKAAVTKFHGPEANIETVLLNYERELLAMPSRHISLRELWQTPSLRSSLLLVLATSMVTPTSASSFAVLFAVPYRIAAGFSNAQAVLINTASVYLLLPFRFVLPLLYERVGRRPIFLVNLVAHIVGGTALVASLFVVQYSGPGTIAMLPMAVWSGVSAVSTGLGSLTFYLLLIADVVPVGAKAITSQVAALLPSAIGILLNLAYAHFYPRVGAWFLLPLLSPPVLCLAYCSLHLPETRARAIVDNFEQVRSRATTVRRDSLLRHRTTSQITSYGSVHVGK